MIRARKWTDEMSVCTNPVRALQDSHPVAHSLRVRLGGLRHYLQRFLTSRTVRSLRSVDFKLKETRTRNTWRAGRAAGMLESVDEGEDLKIDVFISRSLRTSWYLYAALSITGV